MRHTLAIWFALAVCLTPAMSPAQHAESYELTPAPLTLAQYIQALDDSLTAMRTIKGDPQRAASVAQNLPAAWKVEAEGKIFEVSTESIRRDLGAWQKKPETATLDLILRHLETLRYQAAAYETSAPDFASRRSLLNGILARGE